MCKVSYNIKRKLMKNLILKVRELLYNVKIKLINNIKKCKKLNYNFNKINKASYCSFS